MRSNCVCGQKQVGSVCGRKRNRIIKVFIVAVVVFVIIRYFPLLPSSQDFATLAELHQAEHVVQKLSALISSDPGPSTSQRLLSPADTLVAEYSVDFSYPLGPGQSPWQVAESWVTGRELFPERSPQLGQYSDSQDTLSYVVRLQ